MQKSSTHFMQLAISKAWKYQFLTYPNPAVGATIVKDDKVLSVGVHEKVGLPHAEVNALKDAYLVQYPESTLKDLNDSHDIHNYLMNNHNNFFKNCEIYVTLEPCNHIGKTPACAMLIESLGLKKVYIGTLDPNNEASGGLQRLQKANIEVEVGLCKEQTDLLLYPFIKWQQDNFVFFKMAMRKDGSVDGGYITSQKSLNLVHEIRTKIDLMIIGGQTVRIDRPTLDSRFAKNNKSSDILIYSKNKEFDKTIPLFNVKNRNVTITDSLDSIQSKNFVMIEGGYNLLKSLKNKLDLIVVFISHKEYHDKKFDLESLELEKIYSYKINKYDEIVFLKNI